MGQTLLPGLQMKCQLDRASRRRAGLTLGDGQRHVGRSIEVVLVVRVEYRLPKLWTCTVKTLRVRVESICSERLSAWWGR